MKMYVGVDDNPWFGNLSRWAAHLATPNTERRLLPALEAAHINCCEDSGLLAVSTGLLIESDVHRLLHRSLITVTPDYSIEASRLLQEFDNSSYYYCFHGNRVRHPPPSPIDQLSKDFLAWQNN